MLSSRQKTHNNGCPAGWISSAISALFDVAKRDSYTCLWCSYIHMNNALRCYPLQQPSSALSLVQLTMALHREVSMMILTARPCK